MNEGQQTMDISSFFSDFSTLISDVERRNLLTEEERSELLEKCQETIRTLHYLRHSGHQILHIEELINNTQIFLQEMRREMRSGRQRGERC